MSWEYRQLCITLKSWVSSFNSSLENFLISLIGSPELKHTLSFKTFLYHYFFKKSWKQKKTKRWKKSLPFLKVCDEIYIIPCFKDVSPFWIDGHMFFNCYGRYQLLASVIHSVMPTWCLFNGNPWLKLIAEASRFILFNSLLCIIAI